MGGGGGGVKGGTVQFWERCSFRYVSWRGELNLKGRGGGWGVDFAFWTKYNNSCVCVSVFCFSADFVHQNALYFSFHWNICINCPTSL